MTQDLTNSMQSILKVIFIPIIAMFIGIAYADTTCTGATYYDASSNTCVACPTGYTDNTTSGKTDVSQCQRSCAAGTYVATPATVGSTAYTRLEYIENPNGKYIDTGFTHNANATTVRGVLRVGVSSTLSSGNYNFIGNQVSGTNAGGYSLGWQGNFKLWTEATKNRLDGPAYAMTAGTVHEVEYSVTNTSRSLTYDTGETKSDTIKNGKVITSNSIHIYDGGNHQSNRQFKGRSYDLKVYEDGVLVHDFVAARRNQDSVVGMYDIITDTFLTGTGTFTAGPVAGACSDVGVGYYSNASLTDYGSVGNRILCTNGAAHSHYTASATSNSCPYVCDDNYVVENGVCEFQDKFTVTTTSDATQLLFDISAKGTFYVDCGTDGELTQTDWDGENSAVGTVVTRVNTTSRTYSCVWPNAGVHTVKFAGTATAYDAENMKPAIAFYSSKATTASKIASISGSLATMFPQLNTTEGKFPRFNQTFRGATNLTSIPAGLFTGLNPGTNATSMFYQTFYGCSGINTIPAGLFASVTTGADNMFHGTFGGCTSLTAIPSDLFSNVTTAATGLFQTTFKGATNLSSYIPTTTFAGLIANNSPTATDMWTETFSNTNVSTACPVGMDEYSSGYESEWAPKVSCYVACPNDPPANSKWSIINGVCQWLCDEMYYSADGTSCTAVEDGYYSAEGENTRTSCTNKPSNSHYTGAAATDNCPWQCDTGYGGDNGQCRACTASEFWADGSCETAKLTITTTNSTSEFKFFMWEPTGTFYVDWGDGTADTITRTSSTGNTYSHTYSTTGSYTINFGGVATGYDGNSAHTTISFYAQSGGTQDKIASVSGSLVSLFPTPSNSALPYFRETFKGATNLTTIPNTLFSGLTRTQSHMFYHTFDGAGLTAIPYDLFSDVGSLGAGMFEYTFANCTSLTGISSGLFDNMTASGSADDLFEGTFAGCTSLATIPSDLFDDVISSATSGTDKTGWFKDMFNGCTSLAAIPAGLFSGITTGAESLFSGTFYGCTNLSGYIPPSTFAGLISNNSPTDTDMWVNTFVGTNLATLCPSGTTQYITGYEGSINGTTWNGKVSCVPCAAGTYKASAGNTACTVCEIGTYSADAGATACTACTNTKPANSIYTGSAAANNCPWSCDAGYYSTNNTSCTVVGVDFYSAAGDNTRTACPAGLTTVGYGHGADEESDCGRKLHFGDYVVYTKTVKPTDLAINLKLAENDMHYIGLSPTNHDLSKLHLKYNGQEYTAYDDGLAYGERDPLTGNKIEQ